MKKLLLAGAILISSFANAQDELKLDIFDALALKTVEVSYEHYLNEQSSVGVSALFNFEKQSADFRYNEKRSLTPYFRHYFTTEYNWNFFGEAFFSLNYGEKDVIAYGGGGPLTEDYTDGALGVAVGLKYTTDNGFVIDIYGGAGINLFTEDSPVIVPRTGVNLGWRF